MRKEVEENEYKVNIIMNCDSYNLEGDENVGLFIYDYQLKSCK